MMRLNTPNESETSKEAEDAAIKRDQDIQKIKDSQVGKISPFSPM